MSFPYNTIEKENIPCSFCLGNDYKLLSNKGTDGLSLNSVICKKCGLIYINPRMTKDGYKFYYEEEYRQKTINNGDTGSGFDCKKLFDSTIGHGKFLGELISKYLKVNGSIMEVGSGVGGVLEGMKRVLNREVVGIEPSKVESDYANSQGIKTYHTLIEDHKKNEKFAVIVSTQALNHYLDPRYFFKWAHESLFENGLLVLEVMNFRQQLQKAGKYENSVKIDHVYMYTPEVLRDFVKSAGFEILFYEADEYVKKDIVQGIPRVHIRIVAKRINKQPFEELIINKNNYIFTLLSINKYYIYLRYLLTERLPKLLKR
jgi:2-polyprenyl-3-methyl-5-hydroxy-6-metoxy-1,4-benzoquinol methylase